MSRPRFVRLNQVAVAAIMVVVAAILGCEQGEPASQPGPSPADTATPVGTVDDQRPKKETPTPGGAPALQPRGVTTGVQIVDATIRALEGGDAAAVAGLFNYFTVPCSTGTGIGGAECPPGTADGTPVEVIGSGGCEGTYIYRGDSGTAANSFARGLLSQPLGVYAVVRTSSKVHGFPAGYAVIAVTLGPGTPRVRAITLAADGITGAFSGCGPQSLEDMARRFRDQTMPDLLAPVR